MRFTVADAYAVLLFEYAGAIFRGQVFKSTLQHRDFIFRLNDKFIVVEVKLDYTMVPDENWFWRTIGSYKKKFHFNTEVIVLTREEFGKNYEEMLNLLWGGANFWYVEARKRAIQLSKKFLVEGIDEVTFIINGVSGTSFVKKGNLVVEVAGATGNVEWGLGGDGIPRSYFPITLFE